MGLAVGQTTLPNCTGQPPALQSVVNNLNGKSVPPISVCLLPSVLYIYTVVVFFQVRLSLEFAECAFPLAHLLKSPYPGWLEAVC